MTERPPIVRSAPVATAYRRRPRQSRTCPSPGVRACEHRGWSSLLLGLQRHGSAGDGTNVNSSVPVPVSQVACLRARRSQASRREDSAVAPLTVPAACIAGDSTDTVNSETRRRRTQLCRRRLSSSFMGAAVTQVSVGNYTVCAVTACSDDPSAGVKECNWVMVGNDSPSGPVKTVGPLAGKKVTNASAGWFHALAASRPSATVPGKPDGFEFPSPSMIRWPSSPA